MMTGLSSSQLARAGGIHLESVRFYEKQGLLPRAMRTSAGYRVFGPQDVRRVRFIKRAQELGFTLREIKELLGLRLDPDADCQIIRQRAQAKLQDIQRKIRDLCRIKRALERVTGACPGRGPVQACSILENLERESSTPARRRRRSE